MPSNQGKLIIIVGALIVAVSIGYVVWNVTKSNRNKLETGSYEKSQVQEYLDAEFAKTAEPLTSDMILR